MLRFAAGVASALLLVASGFLIWRSQAQPEVVIPPAPQAAEFVSEGDEEPGASRARRPRRPPSATAKSKEERRFGRADKDDDGRITRDELLQPRRKAFAKLDKNGNNSLSFEEWAVKTVEKFSGADADRNGALTPREYATTAPKQRAQPKQNCAC